MTLIDPSRRSFVRSTAAGALAIGAGAHWPLCFAQAAAGRATNAERVLVVVQLSGGNDGLNTVVPFADSEYQRARPKLGLPTQELLKCSDEVGLHPSLDGLRELLDDGMLAIVSGVGYERPNRSHFESMDIWHTCRRKHEQRPDGWLGRYLDAHSTKAGGDVPAMHLGGGPQPFAVTARRTRVPTIQDIAEFQLRANQNPQLGSLLASARPASSEADTESLLGFLASSTRSALAASERVGAAVQAYKSSVDYPDSGLGQKLRTIAQLIDAGLTTTVYYVQLDGFDTHAQQLPAHAALLREWGDALTAFLRDMESQGQADRVCVMSFSEFGRRVQENASAGTDHGAAGPMFLCGGGLTPGFHGSLPSLTDLQDGDLKHAIDFRQVYATVLESWLQVDSAGILGGAYETLPLFA